MTVRRYVSAYVEMEHAYLSSVAHLSFGSSGGGGGGGGL